MLVIAGLEHERCEVRFAFHSVNRPHLDFDAAASGRYPLHGGLRGPLSRLAATRHGRGDPVKETALYSFWLDVEQCRCDRAGLCNRFVPACSGVLSGTKKA